LREIRLWATSLSKALEGQELALGPTESHHFGNVLRGKVGFQVYLMDGLGWEASAVCVKREKRETVMRVQSLVYRDPSFSMTLKGPIPKGKRFPYMLEKCQELGLRSWAPLSTEHSVREDFSSSGREKMTERLQDACKQSRNPWLMHLGDNESLESALVNPTSTVVLDVDGPSIWDFPVPLNLDKGLQLLYGPEAGWSDGEREQFKAQGCSILGLSSYHLRMETAAVVGAGVLLERMQHRHAKVQQSS
jgi:16S rRNA (uracil1498-N3)-methyltransferase